jgi:hypothetical protein
MNDLDVQTLRLAIAVVVLHAMISRKSRDIDVAVTVAFEFADKMLERFAK